MQKHAKYLNKKYGWNVVPLYFLTNIDGKKKVKALSNWDQYKSEMFNLNNWNENYKALSIICGKISNLTIVDVDSEESMNTILNTLGKNLEDLSNYIMRTTRGYQLFYQYEPGMKQRVENDKIDVLNGGKMTFAVEGNLEYKIIKDETPGKIPVELKELVSFDEHKAVTSDLQDFEDLLRENDDRPYRNPMNNVIHDLIDCKIIGRKLKANLEKIFCSKDYVNYTIKEFSSPGQIHNSMMYVLGIVSSTPTISKEVYIDFANAWAKKVAKIDIETESSNVKNRIKGGMKLFRYNPQWKERSESLSNIANIAIKAGYKYWRDPENEKYIIYHLSSKHIDRLGKIMFKEIVAKHYNDNHDEKITAEDVDTLTLETIYETFNPTIDDKFYTNEYGEKMFNHFERTLMLKHFQTCTPRDILPTFIGNVLSHIYPAKAERDLFLHTLAYHMTFLQAAPIMHILTGKSGSGKNIVFENVMKGIYGEMCEVLTHDSITGSFRDLMINKLLIFVDEVNEKAYKQGEKGSIHNVIKQMVANKEISIRAMYKSETKYPNHSLMLMASNQNQPFKLEENFDRRINISRTDDMNIATLKWFPKDKSRPEIDQLVESEIKPFVEYLASIDLSHAKYSMIIENQARAELIENSTPIVDRWVDALMLMDLDILSELDGDFEEWYEHHFIKENNRTIDLKELKTRLPMNLSTKIMKSLRNTEFFAYVRVYGKRCIALNSEGQDKKIEDAFEETT